MHVKCYPKPPLKFLPTKRQIIGNYLLQRVSANAQRLHEVIDKHPSVRAFFDLGGSLELTRHGFGLIKGRVTYAGEGLLFSRPQESYTWEKAGEIDGTPYYEKQYHSEQFSVLSEKHLTTSGGKAVERFANLSPTRLLKRASRRIDPRSIK